MRNCIPVSGVIFILLVFASIVAYVDLSTVAPVEPPLPVPMPVVPDMPPEPTPLPLVPIEPAPIPEPVLTTEPHTAALAICNRVGGQEHHGSGILIKHGDRILAITSQVIFLAGIGQITVTDTRGHVYTATVAALDTERYVVALDVTDLGDAVYTLLTPHSFQVEPQDYWAYGCEGNTFSGHKMYVLSHLKPSPSWTVFDAPADRVRSAWLGGPILDMDGQLAGLLLGRAGPYNDKAIGIDATGILTWLGGFR